MSVIREGSRAVRRPSAASRPSSTSAPTFARGRIAKSAAYYAGWCASESTRVAVGGLVGQGVLFRGYFHASAENIQIWRIGFTWEHPAHLYFKRAKSSELLFGDPTYHRELLAQRIGI